MERNNKYSNSTWEFKTKVSQQIFENFDFSNTDFNSAIFEDVTFKNCFFFKSNLKGSKLFYKSNFEDCDFIDVHLSNTTFGNNKGEYKNCLFEKCDFKGVLFDFTKFLTCNFIKIKVKNTNFNGSTFESCRFVGKLEDVEFNGLYDTNPDPTACLKNVDFSDAQFGEFVTFKNCDLSSCTPPKNRDFKELLYNIELNDPSVLSTGSKDKIILT